MLPHCLLTAWRSSAARAQWALNLPETLEFWPSHELLHLDLRTTQSRCCGKPLLRPAEVMAGSQLGNQVGDRRSAGCEAGPGGGTVHAGGSQVGQAARHREVPKRHGSAVLYVARPKRTLRKRMVQHVS
jgi:hypothetical protein